MKIDFSKLVVLLLPTLLRRTKLAYFIEACIEPARTKYNELVAWHEEKKLELATTAQVCYLEAYLNYKLLGSFNRRIIVETADGITTDFNIIVPADVTADTYQIQALVDKYKLIGKRYDVVGGTVVYSSMWTNFIREVIAVTDAAKWINYHPEVIVFKKDANVYLQVNENGAFDQDVTAFIAEGYAATSDIEVLVQVRASRLYHPTVIYTFYRTIIIPVGASSSAVLHLYEYYNMTAGLSSVTPASDDYYNYINAGVYDI